MRVQTMVDSTFLKVSIFFNNMDNVDVSAKDAAEVFSRHVKANEVKTPGRIFKCNGISNAGLTSDWAIHPRPSAHPFVRPSSRPSSRPSARSSVGPSARHQNNKFPQH